MSRYLASFEIPSREEGREYLFDEYDGKPHPKDPRYKLNAWNASEYYPFFHFEYHRKFEFAPLTILYGNNGSGKSTLLNLIASAMHIPRRSQINQGPHWELFWKEQCKLETLPEFEDIGRQAEIVTSDDVFQHILKLRAINREIEKKKNEAIQYVFGLKGGQIARTQVESLESALKRGEEIRTVRHASSRFVRENSAAFHRTRSNGEAALEHFTSIIKDEGLYLLDEPENSLSPAFQTQLIEYLQCSLMTGCQFVIATHSPLLLGMPDAKIYNLDLPEYPAVPWTELENIRIYHQFFQLHAAELGE